MSKIRGEYKFKKEHLVKMREARMGTQAIAKVYGCHASTIKAALKRFGLPPRLPDMEFDDAYIDAAVSSFKRKMSPKHAPWVNLNN